MGSPSPRERMNHEKFHTGHTALAQINHWSRFGSSWTVCWLGGVRKHLDHCLKVLHMAVVAWSEVELFEKRLSCCTDLAQMEEWLDIMLKWRFQEMPRLKMSQELWESVDAVLERVLSQCMDQAHDPLDMEESVEAVHCTVEEIVSEDRVEVARARGSGTDRQSGQRNSARTPS